MTEEDIINIETKHGIIKFFCYAGKMPIKRAKTLLTKEPDTIKWIDTFLKDDIFWDIGSNVGCYSLYAASNGIKTFSFEPEACNYMILNRNIYINHLDNMITSYCLALNDKTKIDYLYLYSMEPAYSLHNFGEPKNFKGNVFSSPYKQGTIGFSIDELIEKFNIEFPTHIKIDVDGIEHKIIKGAKKTLNDKRLKSILVEISTKIEEQKNIVNIMENRGFKADCDSKPYSGKFKSIVNYIFERN